MSAESPPVLILVVSGSSTSPRSQSAAIPCINPASPVSLPVFSRAHSLTHPPPADGARYCGRRTLLRHDGYDGTWLKGKGHINLVIETVEPPPSTEEEPNAIAWEVRLKGDFVVGVVAVEPLDEETAGGTRALETLLAASSRATRDLKRGKKHKLPKLAPHEFWGQDYVWHLHLALSPDMNLDGAREWLSCMVRKELHEREASVGRLRDEAFPFDHRGHDGESLEEGGELDDGDGPRGGESEDDLGPVAGLPA